MKILIRAVCLGVAFIFNAVCLENLAQNVQYKGDASSSLPFENKWAPSKAVDGHQQGDGESSCSFTQTERSKTAWWKFTLKHLCNVAYLQIFFRKSTVNRHTGFSVYVFNDTSFTPPSSGAGFKVFTQNLPTCPSQGMIVTINKEATGVALFNSKDPPLTTTCEGYAPRFATIEICEVLVMGCEAGHFGDNCDFCDSKCLGRRCDVFNGSCLYGCSNLRMQPPYCKVCKYGFYGSDCTHTCGKCRPGTTCNSITGFCPSGCQEHWDGNKCNICTEGYFSPDCTKTCGKCRTGTYCNNITGVCPGDCQDRWDGRMCDVCKRGFYGPDCTGTCGKCKTGTFCHNITGVCSQGCQEHWHGNKCDVCKREFYGSDCNGTCGKCTTGTSCNNMTGICYEGCQEHWDGEKCDVCKDGYFGHNCEHTCGKCKSGTHCNNITGICPDGCRNRWSGSECDVCKEGFYGTRCENTCGSCASGTYCNNITGICTDGCQSHWNGTKCDGCKGGYFGHNCEGVCSNCKTGTVCNNITGLCPHGCESHWSGSKCNECQDYKYGPNCVFDCGHCKKGKPCSKLNGACTEGCEAGWNGLFCLKVISSIGDLQGGDGISKTSSLIIAIVSTLFVVTLKYIGVRYVLNKRKRMNRHQKEDQVDSLPANSDKNSKCYDKLADTNDDHTYYEIDLKDPGCQEMHVYSCTNTEFTDDK